MLKSLGMLGPKILGCFVFTDVMKSKCSYKCPRELSCTAMRPWRVKLPTPQCVSLQSACSATCIDTAVTTVSYHASCTSILRKEWGHYIFFCMLSNGVQC